MARLPTKLGLVLCLVSTGCSESAQSNVSVDCDSAPVVQTTADGVEFVRTPAQCFESLPGFEYELKSVEIDGLRQGYVDEGPADADPVLLLHGQPSWAYLYRKMIPVLVEGGHRDRRIEARVAPLVAEVLERADRHEPLEHIDHRVWSPSGIIRPG